MQITDLIWLDEIVEKLAIKHHVTQDEVEEALSRRPKIRRMHKGKFRGEDVYRALGTHRSRALSGCVLHPQHTGDALILSARDMDSKERSYYAAK